MKYTVRFLLLFAAVIGLSGSAFAQEQRSLRIRDGKVVLDGKTVPANELPASLDANDLNLEYTFSGDVRPIVAINGHMYALEGDRIVEAGPDEQDGVSIFFRSAPSDFSEDFTVGAAQGAHSTYRLMAPPEGRMVYKFETGVPGDIAVFAPHAEAMADKARELHEHVLRMEELQMQFEGSPDSKQMQQLEETARKMTVQAGEAVRVAEALPRVELQQYLEGIHRRDKGLFNQLVNEREKERETIVMANRIRSMAEGAEREELTEELRQKLSEIFDLKQENRQEEIKALEARLTDLTAKLEDRARFRDDIINRRLRQLLNQQDDLNW